MGEGLLPSLIAVANFELDKNLCINTHPFKRACSPDAVLEETRRHVGRFGLLPSKARAWPLLTATKTPAPSEGFLGFGSISGITQLQPFLALHCTETSLEPIQFENKSKCSLSSRQMSHIKTGGGPGNTCPNP